MLLHPNTSGSVEDTLEKPTLYLAIENYKYIKFNIEKMEHILDSQGKEYGSLFQ